MKIVHINTYSNTSTGCIARNIAKKQIEAGNEVLFFYARGPQIDDVPAERISSKADIYWHGLFSRLFDNHGLNSKRETKKLIAQIKKFSPERVHLHNIHGYYLNYKILFNYLKESKVQVVWTLHDCWPFTGHCAYFDYAGCNKWIDLCCDCPQKKGYPKSLLKDSSKRNFLLKKRCFTSLDVDKMIIVTPSVWLSDLVKKSFLCKYRVQVVNNGIDLSVFKPIESSFRTDYDCVDKFVILGVAVKWDGRKGIDDFIKLHELLDKTKYRIVIVGTDEKIDKMLPNDIISIHRTNNQTELAEIYSTADLFVNPTKEENYPTVNMEAIACGTPVLTYNTGGSSEILTDDTGSVVKFGDIYKMKEEIVRICETKPYLKSNCIDASKKFDMNERFKSYVEIKF